MQLGLAEMNTYAQLGWKVAEIQLRKRNLQPFFVLKQLSELGGHLR